MKKLLKNILASAGILHPALGIKISSEKKVEILLRYKTPEMRTFVETGTEFGTTLKALRHAFADLHSIELDEVKHRNAAALFRNDPFVHLYNGDSADTIREVLARIAPAPTLFWLDAHAPGEITLENSPILGELQAILAHPGHHRILIDDARHFSRGAIREIKRLGRQHGYKYELSEGLFRLT